MKTQPKYTNDRIKKAVSEYKKQWKRETSSGYAGFRNKKTGEWRYEADHLSVISGLSLPTREDFEYEIKKLGFKISKSGNGLNDKILSPKGTVMDWRVCENDIKPFSNNLYGGESFICSVYFSFRSLHIVAEDCISLGDEYSYVLFMNHDKKQKP